MTAKSPLPALAFALCCFAASPSYSANDAADPGRARAFGAATLAKIIPGETTQAQVEKLLGPPWRTTFADDSDGRGRLFGSIRAKMRTVPTSFTLNSTTTI